MIHFYHNPAKCLFCGKPRKWRSFIEAIDAESKITLFKVTVCPKCRSEHTIQEIYEQVIAKFAEEAKETTIE